MELNTEPSGTGLSTEAHINSILKGAAKDSSLIADHLSKGNRYIEEYHKRLNVQLKSFSDTLLEFLSENERLRSEKGELEKAIGRLKKKEEDLEKDNEETRRANKILFDVCTRLHARVSEDSEQHSKWVQEEFIAAGGGDINHALTNVESTSVSQVNKSNRPTPLSQATTVGPSDGPSDEPSDEPSDRNSPTFAKPNSSPFVKQEPIDYFDEPHLPSQLSAELAAESINLDLSQYQRFSQEEEEVIDLMGNDEHEQQYQNNSPSPKEALDTPPKTVSVSKRKKPDFNDEIDEDLTTVRKAVMFSKGGQKQTKHGLLLNTPISGKKPKERSLDDWFAPKKNKHNEKSTPTRKPLKEVINNSHAKDDGYNTDEDDEYLEE